MFMIERHGSPASAILIIRTRIGVVGVLRLLHRKTDQIVTGNVDVPGRDRVQFPGQVAREDRPVHRLVAQLDANFGAVAIDQFCGLLAANQGHVVTRHQQLGRQQ